MISTHQPWMSATTMIDQRLFAEALRFVFHCAATKDVRYYLNGVHFELTPSHLTIVATDGHAMAVAEIAGKFGDVHSFVTVKGSDVKFILNGVKPVKGEVLIGIQGDQLSVAAVGVQALKFQGIDGKFPDWRRVMPHGELEAVSIFGVNAVRLADSAKACDRLSGRDSELKLEYRGVSLAMWMAPIIANSFKDMGLQMAGVVIMPTKL